MEIVSLIFHFKVNTKNISMRSSHFKPGLAGVARLMRLFEFVKGETSLRLQAGSRL